MLEPLRCRLGRQLDVPPATARRPLAGGHLARSCHALRLAQVYADELERIAAWPEGSSAEGPLKGPASWRAGAQ